MPLNIWTAFIVGFGLGYLFAGSIVTLMVHLMMHVEPIGWFKRSAAVVVVALIWPIVLMEF